MPSIKTNVTLNCKRQNLFCPSAKTPLTDGIEKTYKWYIKMKIKKML